MTALLKKLIKIIKRSKRIVIGTHLDPDCDGICSALIVARLVGHYTNKEPALFCSSPILDKYNFLLKDSRFIKKIADFDLLIAVDSADIKRIFPEEMLKSMPEISKRTIVNIDHHRSNEEYGDISIIDENASSTCEVLYNIFKRLNLKIDKSLAELFYSGIYNETGGFIYPNTTAAALRICADLLELKINPSQLVKRLNRKTLAGTLLLSDVLKTIRIKNGIGIMYLTRKMLQKYNTNIGESENFISFLQAIDNVRVSVFFREEENGTRVSLRSDGIIDVNKLAQRFNGGGHRLAAGIKTREKMDAIRKKITKELTKQIKGKI